MYKTDGSCHYNGIKNENDVVKLLNELSLYPNTVQKVGGTKNKEDAISGTKKISIKRKNKIDKGSFDWVNTSKNIETIKSHFQDFFDSIKKTNDETIVPVIRNQFNQVCENTLNNVDALLLKQFLLDYVIATNLDFDVVINDVADKKLYVFPFESHPLNQYLNNNYSISLSGKGSTSRKILFNDGTDYYDCGIRFRIVTNNGITALLGLSKSNKNSYLVSKIQQDNIPKLLSTVKAKVYDY